MRTIHLFPHSIRTHILSMLCSAPPLAQTRQLGILHGQILHDTGACRDCRFYKNETAMPQSSKCRTGRAASPACNCIQSTMN